MITMELLPIPLSVCYLNNGNPKIKLTWLKNVFLRKNPRLALSNGTCQCPHEMPLILSWAKWGQDTQPVKKHSYTAWQLAVLSSAV